MRILKVIDSLRYGGAQKLMVTFAEQASNHNVGVVVVCLADSNAMPLAPLIEAKGAQVVSFPARRLFSPSRMVALYKFVRTGNFSIIHSHLTYANILSYLMGWLCGLPVISSLHSTAQDRRHANYLRDNIELWALRHASLVIAVGQSVKEAYESLMGKMVVLPNAGESGKTISSMERSKLRKSITGDSERPILISVGRFSPDKCFDDLLRGFSLIHRAYPDAVLLIAGDGVLREELVAQSHSLGLDDSVFWLGMRNDVPYLLAASDLYVSVSKREGMPIALLEGMAAGLPVVATPVGDTPYMVKDDAGILVPIHQPNEFARAVLTLLADSNLRATLGTNARKRAIEEFGASKWFDTLMSYYLKFTK